MFCFWRTSFVHSRSGTNYALLLDCFGLKFLPDVRHCVYWVLIEISSSDSSHKIGNKFFIDHCRGWKEGSFVCETVWFFSWVNSHSFDLKFFALCPKFSGDSYVEFQEKTISGEFFRHFHSNQGYPLPKLVKFRPTFCNFGSASVLCWKNSHKCFHILFASGERKARLSVKQFDFFPRWILIRLTWNLSRFVPNLVEILTWIFRKKNYFGIIFHKFCTN